MAALLTLSGLAVSAEEPLQAENVATVSDGNAAANVVENPAEDQIMAYADNIASGMDGNIAWVIDASGKLTLNGTGEAYCQWISYNSQITSAEVNISGMTDASCLFFGCENMTSIDLSGFDTSSVTDMNSMFWKCSSLTSLDLSGFDTGSVTNMYRMFYGCSSLTSLNLSSFDTSSVTDMSLMFGGCSSLTSLDVSGFDTGSVTDMSSMFLGCSSLTSLDVSGFDTSNVTNMLGMFERCSGLRSLNVSGIDTGSVTSMRTMFLGCSGLSGLDVSTLDTGSVVEMEGMFQECSGLTSLDLSGFDTGNVKYMHNLFYGCSGLTSLDLGSFDTGNVITMTALFYGCSGLTNLDLSGFDTRSLTDMVEMFSQCSGLTSLDLSSFNTDSVLGAGMRYMLKDCSNLVTLHSPYNVNISASLPSVTGTVWQCPDGTEVTELPKGLTYSVTLTRSDVPITPQITTTTPDLNMADVVRVKYVPYSYTVETDNADTENAVTFSIVEGRLADGLQIYPATGEIYGVPLEAGEFKIRVMAAYSNPAYLPSYAELTLTVLENTDDNVGVATDYGYDITRPVTGFSMDAMSGEGTQTLVSQGEYAQFRDVYIDGRKLTAGQDYTSEAGSTRITILNQTLADSGEGIHTLGIEFRTEEGVLKRAAQNYVISRSIGEGGGGDNIDGDDSNNSGNVPNGNINSGKSNNDNSNANILPVSTEPSRQDFIIYIVERGDSLWKIAARFYGQGSSWRRIYEDNAAVIRNPGRLYAGQKLVIRLTGFENPMLEESVLELGLEVLEGTTYRVQKGDRLWTIARRAYGSGHLWNIIYEANKDIIADPARIREGQVITVPRR